MKEIITNAQATIGLLFNKIIVLCSIVVGAVLSEIGYPKEVLAFILTLVVVDLFTKQYAIVKSSYGVFSFGNYCKGWKERKLTSRELKNGIGIKAILYMAVLYIAHKASILNEVMYGEAISDVLYTLIIFVESTSIVENFVQAGHEFAKPFLRLIKYKGNKFLDNITDESDYIKENEGDDRNEL